MTIADVSGTDCRKNQQMIKTVIFTSVNCNDYGAEKSVIFFYNFTGKTRNRYRKFSQIFAVLCSIYIHYMFVGCVCLFK